MTFLDLAVIVIELYVFVELYMSFKFYVCVELKNQFEFTTQ